MRSVGKVILYRRHCVKIVSLIGMVEGITIRVLGFVLIMDNNRIHFPSRFANGVSNVRARFGALVACFSNVNVHNYDVFGSQYSKSEHLCRRISHLLRVDVRQRRGT